MARMSIDDKIGRDTRLMRLAKACGWSKRETAGCLVLSVWPLCYDRECAELEDVDVDVAADMDGFAQLMVNAGLATRVKPGWVRVSGSEERIKYLQTKRSAGQKGGIESGKTRKQNASTDEADADHNASTGPAGGNPSVSASAPSSAPVPPSVDPPVGDRSEAAAAPRAKSNRNHRIPSDWVPRPEEQQSARERGLDCADEAAHFRDHHTAKGTTMADWDAAFRTWLKNAKKWGRGKPNSKTPLELQLERVAMLEKQEREGENK